MSVARRIESERGIVGGLGGEFLKVLVAVIGLFGPMHLECDSLRIQDTFSIFFLQAMSLSIEYGLSVNLAS